MQNLSREYFILYFSFSLLRFISFIPFIPVSKSSPTDLFPPLGSHVPTIGGVATAIDRAVGIGCTAMQIFVKNNMQWFAKPLPDADAKAFTEHPLRSRLGVVVAHAGYLINLGVEGVRILDDGWTVVTLDGKPSAHFEHTILVTENEPEVLTCLPPIA